MIDYHVIQQSYYCIYTQRKYQYAKEIAAAPDHLSP